MPKLSPHVLAWSEAQQCYTLSTHGQLEYSFARTDEQAWQSWLHKQTSFSFQTQAGHVSIVKETRSRGTGYWYAYRSVGRHTIKRYLGRAVNVTLVHLQAVAQALTNDHFIPTPQETQREATSPLPLVSDQDAPPTKASRQKEFAPSRTEKSVRHTQPNLLLKRARMERGWSQQEVADLIGAPQAFMVNRWENGVVFPGPDYRKKLCALFQKDLKELGLIRQTATKSEIVDMPDTEEPTFDPAIPVYLSHQQKLIGRNTLLEEIKARLHDPIIHRVALQGLPGIGKTTLAAVLAIDPEIQERFAHGVLWAGLGPRPHLPSLFSRWSRLLGIKGGQSLTTSDAWSHLIRDTIGMKCMLLVIDDAWTIEDALACIVGGPACAYLLTTRFPEVAAHFAGHQIVQVPELGEAEGRALLIDYAPALQEMGEQELHPLIQAVGGLPLALKLVGLHVMLQSRHHQKRRLQATVTRLLQVTERLQLAQPQAGVERDTRLPIGTPLTLQAIIQMSEAVLTERETQALYALSVFPAKPHSFSEDAALAAIDADPDLLDRLVDAGFVEVNGDRYHLHQTIADYARSRRTDHQAEIRLVRYVARFIEQHQDQNMLLGQENQIIFAALELAHQWQEYELYLEMMLHLSSYLRANTPYDLAEQYFQQAYELASSKGDPRVRARIAHNLGLILREQANYPEAEAILRAGLALVPQDTPVKSALSSALGTVLAQQGHYAEAATYMDEAINVAERLDDPWLVHYYETRGILGLSQRDLPRAEHYLLKAYHLLAHQKEQRFAVNIVSNLGMLSIHKGDLTRASSYLQQAHSDAQALLLSDYRMSLDYHQGEIAYLRGAYTTARSLYAQALEQAATLNLQRWVFWCHLRISLVDCKMGHFEQAQAALQYASEHEGEKNRAFSLCQFLAAQGLVLLSQHHPGRARVLFQDALEQARQIQHQAFICEYLIQLAIAYQREGDIQAAHCHLEQGWTIAQKLNMPILRGEALLARGEHALLQAEHSQAREQFEELLSTIPHDFTELIAHAHAGLAAVAATQGLYGEARRQGQTARALFENMQHYQAQDICDFLHTVPQEI
ncbi:helix-turn-helix domain-containing protein [Ktedonospora formicarum]|uniref:HTH cro/C1-type domain-containing protein n=1 Tax=Ktedonospora formicarum TaxID=2778364 RepID=A0A8J3IAQ5_9CHLR|nr:helix-turn-helix domain-containing protein [Ktedonospora formicarum]GHO50536.1 hypothetical protein KSX_86990 [Ktedonospora formicarum]